MGPRSNRCLLEVEAGDVVATQAVGGSRCHAAKAVKIGSRCLRVATNRIRFWPRLIGTGLGKHQVVASQNPFLVSSSWMMLFTAEGNPGA